MKIDDIINEVKRGSSFSDVGGQNELNHKAEKEGPLEPVGKMGHYKVFIQQNDPELYIVYDKDLPIAMINVEYTQYGYYSIQNIFIIKEYRGKGIVSKFLKFIMKHFEVPSILFDFSLSDTMAASIDGLRGFKKYWYDTINNIKHPYSKQTPGNNMYYPKELERTKDWLIMVE